MLVPALVVAPLGLLAVLPMGSAFFAAFRVVVCVWALLTVVHTVRSPAASTVGLQSPKVWPVLLVAVAAGVVWWPYQLTLPKPVWVVLDVLLVVAVLGTAFVIRKAEPFRKESGAVKRRWPAFWVSALTVVIGVAGPSYQLHLVAERNAQAEWCQQFTEQQRRAQMLCEYEPVIDDEDIPGSDHYAG